MANRQTPADPFATIAAQVVVNDAQLQARMKRIINALLNDAEDVVRFGSIVERQTLFRAVVPQLMKSMVHAESSTTELAEKDAFERMMKRMRGESE